MVPDYAEKPTTLGCSSPAPWIRGGDAHPRAGHDGERNAAEVLHIVRVAVLRPVHGVRGGAQLEGVQRKLLMRR